jgi:hypothetical protein
MPGMPLIQSSPRRIIAGAASLVISLSIISVAQSTPASADETVSGYQFSLGLAPEVTGSPGVQAGMIRLWDMGVAWRDVNPAPNVWNWSVLDQRVAQVTAAGSQVLYVAGLTPQWAASDPNAGDPRWGLGTASAPADMGTYGQYIDTLMKRYGPHIGAIEVWNEANLQTFWTGTPDQMADMTARANAAVNANNPGTLVLAASTTTRLASSVKNFFGPYAAALKARGFPMEGWTIHTYPAGNASPVDRYNSIQAWRQVLNQSTGNDPRTPGLVWDTEVNYGLAGPGTTPHTDFDLGTSGAYVARTFVDSIRLGLGGTFWYMWTSTRFSLLGIQMYAGTTATIDPYKRVGGWTVSATFQGCDESTAIVKCFFVKGSPFIVAMSKSGGSTAWNGSTALSGEQWNGESVNRVGNLQIGMGPVKLTCGTGVDAALCTKAGGGGASTAPAPGPVTTNPAPVAKAITIAFRWKTIKGHKYWVIDGTTSGISDNTKALAYVKLPDTKKFVRIRSLDRVDADGTFTWRNRATKYGVDLKFRSGGVTSNIVEIPER